MPRIYVLSGPDLGRTFDVGADATFGRTAECAVTLRDASVSRAHARLERVGESWRIVDAGSRNGLFVGDTRVPTAELADGDEFRLGEVQLRFRADVAAAPTASGPAAPTEPAANPAPEIHFHAGGAGRADPTEPPAEIELEGDWSTAAPQPVAPPPPLIDPRATGSTPTAAPRSMASGERARKLAAAGVAPTARAGAVDARGVLQFHRVEQQEGVLRQDLDQQPTWLRFAVIVLVIAGSIGLAWLGYQAATATKARLAPAETAEDPSR
jgi:pSer/pThr/pTyr-binding forkhead associated (FHA) protein